MNKNLLKITTNNWENESRDIRELNVVKEIGADVLIMAKGEMTGEVDIVKGFKVYRMSTKPLGNKVPASINRIVSLVTWAHQARKFKPDIISGHDLIPLFIGWLSTCFVRKSKKPQLVYDSHEFTIYAGNKSKIIELFTKYLERFLIKKCVFTIEVNDGIADEVKKIHKLKERPVVVRNIPERWNIDSDVCAQMRKNLLERFGEKVNITSEMQEKKEILMSYHGMIAVERGIENLIRALSEDKRLKLLVLGNGKKSYIEKLILLAKSLGVENRVLFHSAVPNNELWKYIGATDVGMVTVRAAWKSYYYMLPNKLFENIQAEVPVVCSDFPVIRDVVEKYEVGGTCNPDDVNSIVNAIHELCNNHEKYKRVKENTKKAKEILCWENEKKVLESAYKGCLDDK